MEYEQDEQERGYRMRTEKGCINCKRMKRYCMNCIQHILWFRAENSLLHKQNKSIVSLLFDRVYVYRFYKLNWNVSAQRYFFLAQGQVLNLFYATRNISHTEERRANHKNFSSKPHTSHVLIRAISKFSSFLQIEILICKTSFSENVHFFTSLKFVWVNLTVYFCHKSF